VRLKSEAEERPFKIFIGWILGGAIVGGIALGAFIAAKSDLTTFQGFAGTVLMVIYGALCGASLGVCLDAFFSAFFETRKDK